jgi:hypothetical protein
MQQARDGIRVEMRDRLGRTTAILDEVEPVSDLDYHRLAKRTFLNFEAPQGVSLYSCHVLAGNREIGCYSRRQMILEA